MPAAASPAGGAARSARPGRGGAARGAKKPVRPDDPANFLPDPSKVQDLSAHDIRAHRDDDLERQADEATRRGAAEQPPAQPPTSPPSSPPASPAGPAPREGSPLGLGVQGGAGLFLGVLLTAVAINFVKAGPAGAGAWFRAKFFNKTTPGTS